MVAQSQAEKLVLRRTYAASPATVYEAWTTPEQMRLWLRPTDQFNHTMLEVDLRVGGNYRIGFESPDGEINTVGGQFREIVPDSRLVYSWMWEAPNEFADIETQITIEFLPSGEGTELVLTQERFPEECMKERHMQGWTGSLDQLHKAVE